MFPMTYTCTHKINFTLLNIATFKKKCRVNIYGLIEHKNHSYSLACSGCEAPAVTCARASPSPRMIR